MVLFCFLSAVVGCRRPTEPSEEIPDPRNISRTEEYSYAPDIAVDPTGNVHIVWGDTTPGNDEILYVSKPIGGSWTISLNVSNTPGVSLYPSVTADPFGEVHVAWEEYTPGTGELSICYSSKPTGGSWSVPETISGFGESSEFPSIGVDESGNVHAVWMGLLQLHYATRPHGGSWNSPEPISGATGGTNPSLAVEPSGDVHVAMERADLDIWYTYKAPGDSWSLPLNLSDNSGYSFTPDIAVSESGGLFVVWYEVFEHTAYTVTKAFDDSLFTEPLALPDVASLAEAAFDPDGNLHITWPSNGETYYRQRPVGGGWSSPINVSNTEGSTIGSPRIAVGPGAGSQLVWSDDTPGNPDIYYDEVP